MLGLQGFFVCWAVSNSVHMYQIHTRIELFVANKKKYPAVSPKKKGIQLDTYPRPLRKYFLYD